MPSSSVAVIFTLNSPDAASPRFTTTGRSLTGSPAFTHPLPSQPSRERRGAVSRSSSRMLSTAIHALPPPTASSISETTRPSNGDISKVIPLQEPSPSQERAPRSVASPAATAYTLRVLALPGIPSRSNERRGVSPSTDIFADMTEARPPATSVVKSIRPPSASDAPYPATEGAVSQEQ